jgi:hypothetical protein
MLDQKGERGINNQKKIVRPLKWGLILEVLVVGLLFFINYQSPYFSYGYNILIAIAGGLVLFIYRLNQISLKTNILLFLFNFLIVNLILMILPLVVVILGFLIYIWTM